MSQAATDKDWFEREKKKKVEFTKTGNRIYVEI